MSWIKLKWTNGETDASESTMNNIETGISEAKTQAESAANALTSGEAIATGGLKAEAVTTAKIAPAAVNGEKLHGESVGTSAIVKEAVTPEKTKPATTPVVGATEGEKTVGTSGVPRLVRIGWKTKKEASTKFAHGLGVENVSVAVFKLTTKKEPTTLAIKEIKGTSTTEVTVVWTAEPTANEEFLIMVWG